MFGSDVKTLAPLDTFQVSLLLPAKTATKNTERGKLYETFIVFGTNGIIDGQLLLTGIVPSCSEAGGSLRPIQDGAER